MNEFNASNKRDYLILSVDASDFVETFLISGVFSVLCIRAFLYATDFPYLGGDRFHIAHVLWGGIFMMVALIILLSFTNKRAKELASVVGGIGFGAFIDELGKFITRDNNYFYEPTIALIYIVFIVIVVASVALERFFAHSTKSYVVNALEILKEAVVLDLDEQERTKALELLQQADPHNTIVKLLLQIIQKAHLKPTSKPNVVFQIKNALFDIYRGLIRKRWFTKALIAFFVASFLIEFIKALFYLPTATTFPEVAELTSRIVSGGLVLLGVFFLHKKKRLYAYEMYKYAVLISILFTQVFLFYAEQLSATIFLVVQIGIYILVRYLIAQEYLVQVVARKGIISHLTQYLSDTVRKVTPLQ